MTLRGTKYIVRRGDTYQIRLPVPLDLQAKLKRKEFRWSLGTGDAPLAKRKGFRATLLFMELCDSVRRMNDISDAKLNEIIRSFWAQIRDQHVPPVPSKDGTTPERIEASIWAATEHASEFSRRYDFDSFTPQDISVATGLATQFGIDFDGLTWLRKKQILEGMMRAFFEEARLLEHRAKSLLDPYIPEDELFKYIDHVQLIAHANSIGSDPKSTFTLQSDLMLGVVVGRFLKQAKEFGIGNKPPVGPSAYGNYQRVLKWLEQSMGESISVKSISNIMCNKFRDQLRNLRKYSSKEQTIFEAQASSAEERQDPATSSNLLGYAKTFFNWLVSESYLSSSPMGNATIGVPKKKSHEKRQPFEPDQIKLLFSSPLYRGCKSEARYLQSGAFRYPKMDRYWMPLVMLYTGSRIDEMASFPAKNFITHDGIPRFELRHADQTLKSDAAQRDIPVHKDLIDLGFLNWAENAKKKTNGSETLFFQDRIWKDRGDSCSKWMNKWIRSLISDERYVVHSFRHHAIDRARDAELSDQLLKQIFGHEKNKDVTSSYGKGASLPVLKSSMDKIDFGLSDEVVATLLK